MRTICILLTFMLLSYNVLAQGILSTVGGKLYVGISAGPSFPLSSYADDNPQDERSGYAKTGYMIELNGGIRLLNLFEISVTGFRNSNGTNLANLVNSVNASYPGNNFTGESGSWEIYGILGGIGVSFPLPQKFIADIRVLGGYQNSSSPEISLTSNNPNTYFKIEGKTVSSPVYFGAASIRHPVANSLYLSLGFQYIGSSAKFENVRTTTSTDGEVSESTISFDRSLDAWGLNVGLKYFIL
ncbi:MAG: hypothetical protein OQJ93_01500 [Ignavibacteriaceae bacterium]|nr:hypothetical protein [Ignavibacteriaceae bacterium]MCW8812045.1 hypothetical protein [Chlorobium sp.]MCW8818591.1 hypothetical protein [Ignavibacteriaceae bacterium]MCW8824679.1 hypothetical protein [Ignavibacteriaceae bacterium]MCW8960731.1 hypothetical protein [Ignavibacteriaceae bacterium]